jgi:hypothetical protein
MPINIPKNYIMQKGSELSRNFHYPIRNFEELANQIGRREVVVYNQTVRISDLRHDIPNDYYPFWNVQDLANKASQLYDRLAGADIWGLHSISSSTESDIRTKIFVENLLLALGAMHGLPSNLREIPAEEIPPFPEKLKNIKHKSRKRGAVIETIETKDVA